MRAVGMTRPQLRATIRWESVIIALHGTVLGLLIGVPFGWALVLAMKNQGITSAASRQRSGDIRAWAKEHGLAVSERGRIPASVVEQYHAAGNGR